MRINKNLYKFNYLFVIKFILSALKSSSSFLQNLQSRSFILSFFTGRNCSICNSSLVFIFRFSNWIHQIQSPQIWWWFYLDLILVLFFLRERFIPTVDRLRSEYLCRKVFDQSSNLWRSYYHLHSWRKLLFWYTWSIMVNTLLTTPRSMMIIILRISPI